MLRVFVYGTLKRGQRNYDRYCKDAVEISPATTTGQLFDLPFGFPGLRVPESAIRATGSADYLADALKHDDITPDPPTPEPPWGLVHGETMILPDAANLSGLDALEGYTPGEKGLYTRALIPVRTRDEVRLAWAYVLTREVGIRLPEGRWPA